MGILFFGTGLRRESTRIYQLQFTGVDGIQCVRVAPPVLSKGTNSRTVADLQNFTVLSHIRSPLYYYLAHTSKDSSSSPNHFPVAVLCLTTVPSLHRFCCLLETLLSGVSLQSYSLHSPVSSSAVPFSPSSLSAQILMSSSIYCILELSSFSYAWLFTIGQNNHLVIYSFYQWCSCSCCSSSSCHRAH